MPMKPDLAIFKEVWRYMLTSRELDLLEQDFVQRGEAFFHVSGSGHENIAFLHPHLIADDFLSCHYRDKSLMLARGVTVKQFFLGLFAKDGSSSHGRQMCSHLSDPAINLMSMPVPVGNGALHAVGVASVIKGKASRPIVYMGIGDGGSQEGEVLDAVAQAVRDQLPVLIVVQDNAYAISTETSQRTFFSRPDAEASEYYGIPIERIDGLDPVESYQRFGEIVERMRQDRKPAIVVFKVERLNSHTNADDHRVYRAADAIETLRKNCDPVLIIENWLRDQGFAASEIDLMRKRVKAQVLLEAEEAQESPEPQPVLTAKAELPSFLTDPAQEYRGSPAQAGSEQEQFVMLEALREVLKFRMAKDHRVTLFGEDLEDPKGDVFGVTRGLTQAFPGRVVNSPLSETTIVGFSIGQALAGSRPVAFLQFADFFSIAFNQIWAEMGSMHWRTGGEWKLPLIIMVSCGAFKPGLGPFHGSSMESFAAHVPGIDVFLPSTAGDAAGLLNAAFESERPTIFFYPKSCLNDRTQATSRDISRQLVPIGRGRYHRRGQHLTMVGWGNCVAMLGRAAKVLEESNITCDIIDLRSISPWDQDMVLESARRTGRLIIAQEDNLTASMASEISATVAEKAGCDVRIRRVTRPDTWIPFHFGNQLEILPSYKRILDTAVELLEGTVTWKKAPPVEAGMFILEAMGSSPSDESVTIVEWKIQPGDTVTKGMKLADAEADKAVFEISSPAEGTVEEILVPVGDMVKVATPLLRVKTAAGKVSRKLTTTDDPGVPRIHFAHAPTIRDVLASPRGAVGAVGAAVAQLAKNTVSSLVSVANKVVRDRGQPVHAGIAAIAGRTGSRVVSNAEISKMCPEWNAEDIYKRIGILNRYWVAPGETALSMATEAARKVLNAKGLVLTDIDVIVVTTGSPLKITPSMACMVLAELAKGMDEAPLIQAVDLSAACSGFIYGLQYAHDLLAARPDSRVLLITTEVLSPITDETDPATAPIFGDAATASIIVGASRNDEMRLLIERPILGAKGEDGSILRVPRNTAERIFMDGPKVFLEAVKNMLTFLERACAQSGMKASELDLVIPHQANQRIINAVRQKAKLSDEKVYSVISEFGNTSSSSIPLCIERLWENLTGGQTWGLCAFGGGFTFGGAILRTR